MNDRGLAGSAVDYDVVIVGAGIAGLYQLHRLRQAGVKTRLFEAGSGVGGTWFWNRYPGSRFDSESYSYAYTFDDELMGDWVWSERFAGQEEIERYLNHVADRFCLREDIELNSRVVSAVCNESNATWHLEIEGGALVSARILITCTGVLSEPVMPTNTQGLSGFQGDWTHTARWPKDGLDLAGRRVAVLGTGSTGVQIIQTIAPVVDSLTVLQRHPAQANPLQNRPFTPEQSAEIHSQLGEIKRLCNSTSGGFLFDIDPRNALEVSEAERREHFEMIWAEGGLRPLMGNFMDVLTNLEANGLMLDFFREKIAERVTDPAKFKLLTDWDYPYGGRRPPAETGYYEAFNQDNVDILDVAADPIVRYTHKGLETESGDHEFDVIIFATGFDAVTGGILKLEIQTDAGLVLRDRWARGATSYLGVAVSGLPNLFMVPGPQGLVGNNPVALQFIVDFVSDLVIKAKEAGASRIEVTAEAERAWSERVANSSKDSIYTAVDSWINGGNVPGKPKQLVTFAEGLVVLRQALGGERDGGFPNFALA
ncbi:MAG: flavin-containing monooxygenase [Ilumatobacteraceae bacterium]